VPAACSAVLTIEPCSPNPNPRSVHCPTQGERFWQPCAGGWHNTDVLSCAESLVAAPPPQQAASLDRILLEAIKEGPKCPIVHAR
jgi:hypothetical protein